MNYSEMLHDFLDSSLNGSGEETLFRALATDDELRFELKYLLKLRDAVRDDDEALVVPVASTNAIFAQLGYTAPAAVVGAAGGFAGAQAGLWPLLKSAGGYLLAMLIGAFVTTGIFLMNDDDGKPSLATADRPAAAQTQGTPGTSAPANPSPVSGASTAPQATKAVNSSALSNTTPSNVRKSSPRASAATPASNVGTENGTDAAASDGIASEQSSDIKDAEAMTSAQSQSPTESPATTDERAKKLTEGIPQEEPLTEPASTLPPASTEERSDELKLESPSLEVKRPKVWREATWSVGVRAAVLPFDLKSPTTTLPESTKGIDNITASVLYPLPFYRNVAFMFEAGKETYLLTFNERRSDGRIFQHEVMPSVFWAGAGARFSFSPNSRFNPFVQIVGGGSEAGLIGRGMLGLQWSINDQFGMMGGLEYNMAAYRFQGETTTSPKLGINYGLTFNLFGN